MNERLSTPETEPKPIQILEIGSGVQVEAATANKGSELSQPNVHYTGIDLPQLFWPAEGSYESRINQGLTPRPEDGEAYVAADGAKLPFPDATFKTVLMRSVFGELSMDEEFQSSNAEALLMSLGEILRVLQAEGELVIAEENTPFDAETLMQWLVAKGFMIKDLRFMEANYDDLAPDSEWKALREKYYTNRPTSQQTGSYILIAQKPMQVQPAEF